MSVNRDLRKRKYLYDYFDNNCTTKLVELFQVNNNLFFST
ncbi:DUF4105 domain-containing protein [Sinomicrobium pectinilyticum]|uniref:DUF4105 domain-containing protein n=1 Tax=Sinomicrobium pectinilyticum TaxID=1084421 RepID=A0A3N0DRK2_SINP1|nr:DUF4105 domain-containing protein [Sinomicrobium pectinilyticum]